MTVVKEILEVFGIYFYKTVKNTKLKKMSAVDGIFEQ